MLLPCYISKNFPLKVQGNQKGSLNVAMERYCFFFVRKLIIKATNTSITLHGNKIFDFPLNFLRQLLMGNLIGCQGNSATTPFFLISGFLILNKMIKVT